MNDIKQIYLESAKGNLSPFLGNIAAFILEHNKSDDIESKDQVFRTQVETDLKGKLNIGLVAVWETVLSDAEIKYLMDI